MAATHGSIACAPRPRFLVCRTLGEAPFLRCTLVPRESKPHSSEIFTRSKVTIRCAVNFPRPPPHGILHILQAPCSLTPGWGRPAHQGSSPQEGRRRLPPARAPIRSSALKQGACHAPVAPRAGRGAHQVWGPAPRPAPPRPATKVLLLTPCTGGTGPARPRPAAGSCG